MVFPRRIKFFRDHIRMSVIILNYFGGYLKVMTFFGMVFSELCYTFRIEPKLLFEEGSYIPWFGQCEKNWSELEVVRSKVLKNIPTLYGWQLCDVMSFNLCIDRWPFSILIHFRKAKKKLVDGRCERLNWKHWKRIKCNQW